MDYFFIYPTFVIKNYRYLCFYYTWLYYWKNIFIRVQKLWENLREGLQSSHISSYIFRVFSQYFPFQKGFKVVFVPISSSCNAKKRTSHSPLAWKTWWALRFSIVYFHCWKAYFCSQHKGRPSPTQVLPASKAA